MRNLPNTLSKHQPSASLNRRVAAIGVVFLLLVPGCLFSRGITTGLPSRYKVGNDDLEIRSDTKIAKDSEIFAELSQLRSEVVELLDLPEAKRPVRIHLFSDEARYAAYMQNRHPTLPPRRAFFIGTPSELAVYAYRGPSMMEDLRHEYTHGVLHASLKTVPLWLDEGIAEYFEVRKYDSQRRHPEHSTKLASAIANGWKPDLRRLEKIESVSQMQRPDYQEAWAWVHYLIHECPDGRGLLANYCQSLAASDKPPMFANQLEQQVPEVDIRLVSYLGSSLSDGPVWAVGSDQP